MLTMSHRMLVCVAVVCVYWLQQSPGGYNGNVPDVVIAPTEWPEWAESTLEAGAWEAADDYVQREYEYKQAFVAWFKYILSRDRNVAQDAATWAWKLREHECCYPWEAMLGAEISMHNSMYGAAVRLLKQVPKEHPSYQRASLLMAWAYAKMSSLHVGGDFEDEDFFDRTLSGEDERGGIDLPEPTEGERLQWLSEAHEAMARADAMCAFSHYVRAYLLRVTARMKEDNSLESQMLDAYGQYVRGVTVSVRNRQSVAWAVRNLNEAGRDVPENVVDALGRMEDISLLMSHRLAVSRARGGNNLAMALDCITKSQDVLGHMLSMRREAGGLTVLKLSGASDNQDISSVLREAGLFDYMTQVDYRVIPGAEIRLIITGRIKPEPDVPSPLPRWDEGEQHALEDALKQIQTYGRANVHRIAEGLDGMVIMSMHIIHEGHYRGVAQMLRDVKLAVPNVPLAFDQIEWEELNGLTRLKARALLYYRK